MKEKIITVVQGKDEKLRIVRLVMESGLPGSVYKKAIEQAGAVCHFEWVRYDSRGRLLGEGYL